MNVLAIALVVLVSSSSDMKLTCRAGETRLKAGATRVFEHAGVLYGCSARFRVPRRIDAESGEVPSESIVAGPRFGRHVLVLHNFEAETFSVRVGWWDDRDGTRRWGAIDDLQRSIGAAAIAPDGAIALLLYDADGFAAETIAFMCRGRTRLASPRDVAQLGASRVDPESLTVTRATIRWRTRDGTPAHAARDERRCTA